MTRVSANALQPEGCSARLWRVLMSLAKPPEDESARSLTLSSGVEILAVEFDEAYTHFVEGFDHLPSESQMLALQAVDTKLAAMIRAEDATLWTARACREDASWSEVRVLAKGAIGEFGWPRTLV